MIANIAWPNEWVILVGSLLSTIGAGLQSLTGAPRLLQAIAKDQIISALAPLGVSNSRGEPARALLLTVCKLGHVLAKLFQSRHFKLIGSMISCAGCSVEENVHRTQ